MAAVNDAKKLNKNNCKQLLSSVFSPGETRAVEVARSVVDSQLGGKNNAAPLSLLQPTTNQLGIINFWIRYIFENVDDASNTILVCDHLLTKMGRKTSSAVPPE